MSQAEQIAVTDKNGVRGVIDVTAPPPFDGSGAQVLVRLTNGQQVIVPTEALIARKAHGYFLPLSLVELETPQPLAAIEDEASVEESGNGYRSDGHSGEVQSVDEALVVPVIAEEVSVEKRLVETGRVRITKTVHEREETIDEPLARDEVNVERVDVNRIVDGPVPVRYVGDTMIVPLLEEVLVVEKRLMLKAELHVTKRRTETHRPQTVLLRREEATVERVDSQTPPED